MAADDPESKALPSSPRIARLLRWIVAIVLIVVGVSFTLGGSKVCEETQAEGGQIVDVCRAPGLTDVPVVGTLVIVGLLMWPELSEIGVPGFLSIKRRIENTEKRTEEQTRRQDSMETQLFVAQTRLETLSSSYAGASSSSDTNFFIGQEFSQDLLDNLKEKVAATESRPEEPVATADVGDRSTASSWDTWQATPDEDTDNKLELISIWEGISERLFLNNRGSRMIPPEMKEPREYFLTNFEDEIAFVRLARNNVAHAKPLSAADTAEAVNIGHTLLNAFDSFFEDIPKRRPKKGADPPKQDPDD